MSLIIGLDHVNLLIDAGEHSLSNPRAFYEGLLGLVPLERPANTDSGNPGAWYQCGVQQLHLTTEKDTSVVNRNSRRHPRLSSNAPDRSQKRNGPTHRIDASARGAIGSRTLKLGIDGAQQRGDGRPHLLVCDKYDYRDRRHDQRILSHRLSAVA